MGTEQTRPQLAAGHHRAARRAARTPHAARAKLLWEFWLKINYDWIFNLSGLLAYGILVAAFPVVLVLLALAGFALAQVAPEARQALIEGIINSLPVGMGAPLVDAALEALQRDAGLVLLFGLGSAFFFGSRLFVVLEDCFGVIFRAPSRPPVRQNLMAIVMMGLYTVLLPLIFLSGPTADALAASLSSVAPHGDGDPQLAARVLGILASCVSGLLLFGITYLVVPNYRTHWYGVWKGALLAAALLTLYQLVFPIYQVRVLALSSPGGLMGAILIFVIFFYYLAFIMLLGAEVNSWALGKRALAKSIPSLLLEQSPADLGTAAPESEGHPEIRRVETGMDDERTGGTGCDRESA